MSTEPARDLRNRRSRRCNKDRNGYRLLMMSLAAASYALTIRAS
jgi:hypothetical protein